jgi:hypothetical protein
MCCTWCGCSLSQVCLATEQQVMATDGPLVKLSSHAELLSMLLSLRNSGSTAATSPVAEQRSAPQLVLLQHDAGQQVAGNHAKLWPSIRSLTDSPMEYHGHQQNRQEHKLSPGNPHPVTGLLPPYKHMQGSEPATGVTGSAQPAPDASVLYDPTANTGASDSWIPDICLPHNGDAFSLQVPGAGSMLTGSTSSPHLVEAGIGARGARHLSDQAALSMAAGLAQDWVGPVAGLLAHTATSSASMGSGLTDGARLLMQGASGAGVGAQALPYAAAGTDIARKALTPAAGSGGGTVADRSAREHCPLGLPSVEQYSAPAEEVPVGPLLSSLPAGVLQMDGEPGTWTIFEAPFQPLQDSTHPSGRMALHLSHQQLAQPATADADGLASMESLLPTPKWGMREEGGTDVGLDMRPSLGMLSSAASLGSVGLGAFNSSLPAGSAQQLAIPAVHSALGTTGRRTLPFGLQMAGVAAPAAQPQQQPIHLNTEEEVLRVALLALQVRCTAW